MTSNIQHGVTSHYPSVRVWGTTAKSLEGMEIGIGCTTDVPGLRSGGVSQVVDQELSKMGEARAEVPKLGPWAKPIN